MSNIHQTNSSAVDLNLLRVFDAMLQYQSVSRAAEALALSQPAMSAAVGRLRKQFDDPLFVRTGTRMSPTPRAETLAPHIRQIMATIENQILKGEPFDPARSKRGFALITPDIAEANLLPRILARLHREAPLVQLQTSVIPSPTAAQALENGVADLAIGYFPDLERPGFYRQRLFQSEHVCLFRKQHPGIGKTLTLKKYLALEHALVRPGGREHVFDRYMQHQPSRRHVVIELSHFMSLLPVLEASDLIATIPKDLALLLTRYGTLRFLPVPLNAPVIDVHLFWHERGHHDEGHQWLRRLVFDVLGGG